MSSFFLALHTILPLFLVILFGILMIRVGAATEAWVDILNKYALKIGFPALIFAALTKMDIGFAENSTLLFGNSLYLIGCMLMAFPLRALFKTSVKAKQTMILTLAFCNITYLGIPVLISALGQQAMGSAVILTSVYLFWMFSLALVLIEVAGEGKLYLKTIVIKLVTNPDQNHKTIASNRINHLILNRIMNQIETVINPNKFFQNSVRRNPAVLYVFSLQG